MNRILRVRSLIPQARANLSTSVKRFDNAKVRRNQERFQSTDQGSHQSSKQEGIARSLHNGTLLILSVSFGVTMYYLSNGKGEKSKTQDVVK
ncbi:uncharacterized protein LOC117106186 isoform X1 [Anneissia japonica]|uniref:uncharacterized protein LOC117106186 isoform X1 n=1 Tax=Anneissia japonica TaxID=1529436 RepID=UPI00142563D7|nr:uncharacterized protein LOC117106186 isoform X1 [Anneissia japonica]